MTEKQYKPFNLERALAGDKFARKSDLVEPSEFYYFKTDASPLKLCTIFNGNSYWYNVDGERNDNPEHALVMLPKTKKLWIAVRKDPYCDESSNYCTSSAFSNYDDAKDYAEGNSNYQIVEVEIDCE